VLDPEPLVVRAAESGDRLLSQAMSELLELAGQRYALVVLDAGTMVPADLRILRAKDLFVAQSALTGESMPVEKVADPNQPAGRVPFEFTNACFMGSNVLSGSARALVLTTGTPTAMVSSGSANSFERMPRIRLR